MPSSSGARWQQGNSVRVGTCISVLFREPFGGQAQHHADVILREERGGRQHFFCETIKPRKGFWFTPDDLEAGPVLRFFSGQEPEEKEEFRRSEVERLQAALGSDGRTLFLLDNQGVKEYPEYLTAPSQIRVRVTVLGEDCAHSTRQRISGELEQIMENGATHRLIRGSAAAVWQDADPPTAPRRRVRSGASLAAELAEIRADPEKRAAFLKGLLDLGDPPQLTDYDEYRCWARFECTLEEACLRIKYLPADADEAEVRELLALPRGTTCAIVLGPPEGDRQQRVATACSLPMDSAREIKPRLDRRRLRGGRLRTWFCNNPNTPDGGACVQCGRLSHGDWGWTSVLAWGVYDSSGKANCNCPPTTRLAELGCKHVLKDRRECVEHDVHQPARTQRQPWLPRPGAGPVNQHCRFCNRLCIAKQCEVFFDQEPVGKHLPEHCPKCIDRGTWCSGSLHKSDVTARYAEVATLLDPNLAWRPTEAGLEAETTYDGRRVLVQLRPWLFFVPKHRRELFAMGPAEGEELAHGDRQPAGADPQKLLWLALRGLMRQGFDVRAASDAQNELIAAFVSRGESRGGRFVGGWRAYRPGGGRADYGERHGVTYFKPRGWVKRRVMLPDFEAVRDWPIVYHGTKHGNAANILIPGRLEPPGSAGVEIAHGQAGGTGHTMYCTPSIYLASHPVYSELFPVGEGTDADDTWGQVVLQCKIRPGSWQPRRNTLGYRHWPADVRMDPNFPNNENFEFLYENPEDLVVIGLMYRELGRHADAGLYGELVTRVTPGARGPQYELTQLLAEHHRVQGLLVSATA